MKWLSLLMVLVVFGGGCINRFDDYERNNPYDKPDAAPVIDSGHDTSTDIATDAPVGEVWTDSTSGLIWQVEPTGSDMNWSEAKTHCGGLTLGGYSDWWLPTISELRSLIRGCPATETGGSCGVTDSCLSVSNCAGSVCDECSENAGPTQGCYWPAEMGSDCITWYWSSSQVADDDYNYAAWHVNFGKGRVAYYNQNLDGLVRCVRTDASVEEVWTDLTSGLMWQVEWPGGMNWSNAKTYCEDLALGGHSDWRLPTISELRSLIRGCEDTETGGSCGVTDSCLNWTCTTSTCYECIESEGPDEGCYWPAEMKSTCNWLWSSSAVADRSDSAWCINFNDGRVTYALHSRTNVVLCVR